MKTIDIQAKEWFDKINGNSYFSAVITIDYKEPTEQTIYIPFQNGYGSYYLQKSREELKALGLIPETVTSLSSMEGVILRNNIQRNCLKREVIQHGKPE